MKIARFTTLVLLAGLLAASAFAAAQEPDAAQLMEIVFPGWHDSGEGHEQVVTLEPHKYRWGDGPTRVIVDPQLLVHTGLDAMTLLAGLAPSDQGKSNASHVDPMVVSAYHFIRAGTGWRLASRQEGFAFGGGFGKDATLSQVALAAHTQGIALEAQYCNMGTCVRWMQLYVLDKGKVRPEPVADLLLANTDFGLAEDCARRLRPLIHEPPFGLQGYDIFPSDWHDCYSVEGSWSITPSAGTRPGDLTVRFRGAMSRAATDPGPPVAIRQRMVMRYSHGKYQVVSGRNPVPPV